MLAAKAQKLKALATHNEWTASIRYRDTSKHSKQEAFIEGTAKRTIVRAGRRGGKTVGVAKKAVKGFAQGRRVLYTAPTQEQIDTFWYEVKWMLTAAIENGALYKNETMHYVEVPNTKNRLRAKTAWNADTMRGDYGDLLIMDEYQLMSEDAWGLVGAPMLLDNNGDAVFIYTPPSLHARHYTKARDSQHAAKLYKSAAVDTRGRWQAMTWTSHDNPYISVEALEEITSDMTALAYEQEILAEDKDEAPGALWTRATLERTRVFEAPDLQRIVIAVDPPGGATECGIVASGLAADGQLYVLEDASLRGSPETWASAVIACYQEWEADKVVAEKNYGGDMVQATIKAADEARTVRYQEVQATRGKAVRAEPIAALFERGKAHMVGVHGLLEDELCMWQPGSSMASPNRLDALVWALTELYKNDGKIALPVFMD